MAQLTRRDREEIARRALALSEQLREDTDLAPGELAEMGLDDLVAYLADHGVTIDMDLLEQETRASLGADVVRLNRGQALDDAAKQALEDKVERAVERAARSVARQTVFNARDSAMFEADTRDEDEQFYAWISVGKGVCPSCHDLHGNVFALDQWEEIGKPRDGNTICGSNCRCTLVPVQGKRDVTRERQDVLREGLEPRR